MAFNGSGTFTRVHDWTTDLTNQVPVTASRMDSEDDGFATGLSTTICKDGQTTTTARIPFAAGIGVSDGTVSAPGINFSSDTNTGLYRIGADNLGFALGGTKYGDWTTTGLSITGTVTASLGATITAGGLTVTAGGLTVTDGGATITAGGVTITAGGLTINGGVAKAQDGTKTAPGYSWASDTDTGFYRIGANNIGISCADTKIVDITTSGLSVTGGLTASTSVTAATVAGSVVATQAQMETATATDVVVTPGRAQYHPGAAKGWAYVTSNLSVLSASHNVSGIVRNGAGDITVSWDTDFSSANYVVVAICEGSNTVSTQITAKAAGSVRVTLRNGSGTLVDDSVNVIAFGDQ